jgi:uncharacterized protein YbjT (DUF2867 family)
MNFVTIKKDSKMKITVTGSLGNISRPLTEELVRKGHELTVISSKAERIGEIEAMGAKAAIGRMQDVDFLTEAFTGADIVYLMEAVGFERFFDKNLDLMAAIREIGESYRQAIERSGVKRIVHLSSIGAHTNTGSGMLAFHHEAEKIMNGLPGDVSIKFMRPVGFYYNLFPLIPMIRSTGKMMFNYGGDEKEPWVSPNDIAAAIAEEMEKPFSGRSVRYIASDEVSPNEIAQVLGEAIGKEINWETISDEEYLGGLLASGMNPEIARGYMEMNASRRGGVLYEDYLRNRPELSRTKLEDFARDFAAAYNRQ